MSHLSKTFDTKPFDEKFMALQSFKYRLNAYRRYNHWKKQGAIFIHVPKVAGTSISNALYGRTLGHYPATYLNGLFPDLFASCFTFCFVRNPWSRVLSAYRFARMGRNESMGIANPARYQTGQFVDFETFLHDWISSRVLSNEDFVFRPQHQFVCDGSGVQLVEHVGKLEDFKKDLQIVESRLGRKLLVGHTNRTACSSDYRGHYLSYEMIDIVAKKYRKDIEIFGYDF